MNLQAFEINNFSWILIIYIYEWVSGYTYICAPFMDEWMERENSHNLVVNFKVQRKEFIEWPCALQGMHCSSTNIIINLYWIYKRNNATEYLSNLFKHCIDSVHIQLLFIRGIRTRYSIECWYKSRPISIEKPRDKRCT